LLSSVGLFTLVPKFEEEKVDFNVILSAGDEDLIRLGVTTIGDRVRLRDACRRASQYSSTSSSSALSSHSQSGGNVGSSGSDRLFQQSYHENISEERRHLFSPRNSTSRGNKEGVQLSLQIIKKTGIQTFQPL